MFKRIPFAIVIAALVAGCSSGVDLDNVPVEDKSGAPLSTSGANGANSGNTGQSGVRGVDLTQSDRDGAGPVGVSRIVYFDYDSYVIKSDYQSLIEAHARFIKTGNARKVVIEGHTDDLSMTGGAYPSNWELSGARAGSVARLMEEFGVKRNRMEIAGYADTRPRVANETASLRRLNRRIDVLIKPAGM